MDNDGLDKLVKDLGAMGEMSLSTEKRSQMKLSLMRKLPEAEVSLALISDLRKVGSEVKMNVVAKARVKENIFAKLYRSAGGFFFWQPFRKFVGAALAVVMFFGVFVYFKPTNNFVSASEISFINSFEGEVWVLRDGERVVPKVGFELLPGDEVLTAENAQVEIYFFDDSRSQLAGSSRLVIDELAEIAEEEKPGTYVKVSLLDGRVWSKVVDLPEQSAFVVEAEGKVVETDRAAFDVEVSDKKVSIGVFNSSVAVKNKDKVEKVLSGQKIVFENSDGVKAVIGNEDRAIAWVKTNLKIDQNYLIDTERNLIAAKIQAIGDDFSTEADLNFLNYDDVAKRKESLLLAEKSLATAQYDITNGRGDATVLAKAIGVFTAEVESFYALVAEVRYTDPAYADNLKQFVDGRVLAYKNDLAATLPTSPAYAVKDAINYLEIKTVTDPVKALEIKVSQVEDTIADVDQVKDLADQTVLKQVTDTYVQDVKTVMNEINDLSDQDAAATLKIDLIDDFSVIDSLQTDPYQLKETYDGKFLPPEL